MSSINNILTISPVFKSVEKQAVEKLGTLFEKRDIVPGDVLSTAGEPAQKFFVLGEGAVLLGMDAGKSVVLSQTGDFIAMELLSSNGIYKTSVSVLEKGEIFAIPREEFLQTIQEDSPAAMQIMDSWQDYLNITAPFATKIDDLSSKE